MSPSFPEPLVFSYRGVKKVWATVALNECSNCSNVTTEAWRAIHGGYKTEDEAFRAFKREVNIKISTEELV
jgi:hypothetical protein